MSEMLSNFLFKFLVKLFVTPVVLHPKPPLLFPTPPPKKKQIQTFGDPPPRKFIVNNSGKKFEFFFSGTPPTRPETGSDTWHANRTGPP